MLSESHDKIRTECERMSEAVLVDTALRWTDGSGIHISSYRKGKAMVPFIPRLFGFRSTVF